MVSHAFFVTIFRETSWCKCSHATDSNPSEDHCLSAPPQLAGDVLLHVFAARLSPLTSAFSPLKWKRRPLAWRSPLYLPWPGVICRNSSSHFRHGFQGNVQVEGAQDGRTPRVSPRVSIPPQLFRKGSNFCRNKGLVERRIEYGFIFLPPSLSCLRVSS